MPRDHARVNVTIWGDPKFRELPPPAQHLYLALWTSPDLSYCGVHDWRPSRLTGLAAGWGRETVEAAAACLVARHFLVIDHDTEEVMIRSWIRWDGLMKQPRMAISCITAYAAVASPTIREVLVHQLEDEKERQPGLSCWGDQRVQEVLTHPSSSPKSLPTPDDPFRDGFRDGFGDGFTPDVRPGLAQTQGKVSVPPTPAPAPAPYSCSKNEGPQPSDTKRGTRVPDDFSLTPEMKEWAAEHTPSIDVAGLLDEFIDYWRGVPGQKGVKLDWISTWRNAMRKQQKWATERTTGNVSKLQHPRRDGRGNDQWMYS